jgi:hypothetical protein
MLRRVGGDEISRPLTISGIGAARLPARSIQAGAPLASGVSQQAFEQAAGIRLAGVISARATPVGKIPFGGASFGDQVRDSCRLSGRPVRVKREREVQRLGLRHSISETISDR